jgi:Na+/proline symporter
MLGGFGASVVWLTWFKAEYYGLYEAVPGFMVGLVLTFGVSYMSSEKK